MGMVNQVLLMLTPVLVLVVLQEDGESAPFVTRSFPMIGSSCMPWRVRVSSSMVGRGWRLIPWTCRVSAACVDVLSQTWSCWSTRKPAGPMIRKNVESRHQWREDDQNILRLHIGLQPLKSEHEF